MKNLIFALVLLMIVNMSITQAQIEDNKENSAGSFTITVIGFESDEGKVMIALFNSEEGYSETGEKYNSIGMEIKNSQAEWIIEELPFGEYAIKLYHDENGNGKMDKNMLGIPSEDYGFSNNATGSFGPADYEDAKFIFNSSGQKHEIDLD